MCRCQEPRREGQETAWECEWGTPLVAYKVRFYGLAPGKIEYINATVSQSNQPKDSLAPPLFVNLAGLHFDGGGPGARARVGAEDDGGWRPERVRPREVQAVG